MPTMQPSTFVDRTLVAALTRREEQRLEEESPRSAEVYESARTHLAAGVSSSYQARDPYPVYYTHAKGSSIWTVDGRQLCDFHNAFGCMVQGHAHPVIVEAVQKRMELGSQFGLPTEDAAIVAAHLAENYRLPKWRFVNSGSEATMDAIRLARAFTGRETVLKVFGSYHGHHDYVMVSVPMNHGDIGPREAYRSLPYGGGIPSAVVEMTLPVPFNDAEALERRIVSLAAQGRLPACMIMEPAMMNIGVVLPEDGYLQRVRDITSEYGVVLIFDEVKTGICTAPGGGVERWAVVPDIVCLAKALAAGLPSGALGASDEIMRLVEDWTVYQVGTYSGNPLSMAAARASLESVMTEDAYAHLNRLNDRLIAACDAICKEHDFPGYAVGISSKGCVNFATGRIRDYETFMEYQDAELCNLAWLYSFNRGVLMAPGREEEWTLSIQHTDEDVDRYVSAFGEMVGELTS
jgi:glutamate-1-semialdehyde 2,1-aminomutase